MFSTIDQAIADLRAGKVIVVVDDADRENEGDFVIAAEKATPETFMSSGRKSRAFIGA